ncbi:IS110 family transposase [Pseudomonas sp. FP603]|uniref:IS110 family transposase n=1 Tax=Pseudomonas sp. FP603 TaxID=2954097 RepID=UPI0027361529|nr:IS110 family transposase [Pseudomonas sp. FP603]WLI10877.1 IS110 family transposase [Pseudomonas sp. FP603]
MSKSTSKKNSLSANNLSACTTVAVDLAKSVFQVAGEDHLGQVIYEKRLKSREAFSTFLRQLPPGTSVLMETGPGAQAWARLLLEQGNQPRILPAQHVAKHRSGPKNDRNDVLAILRAGRDERAHAVPVKTVAGLEMQALHRVRRRYVKEHTAMGNQMRGLLLEHGFSIPQGKAAIDRNVTQLLEDSSQPIPALLHELIAELLAEWKHMAERIEVMTGRLERAVREDDTAKRLMTVRGVGPIFSSAVIAKQTEPERFANARDFAAYFGTVPEQYSSGNTIRLGKMAKRGDAYIRSLAIQGAHAVLRQLNPSSDHPDDRRLQRWLGRHGQKGAAVRLANRNLRIIWVLLQNKDTYHRQPAERQEVVIGQ